MGENCNNECSLLITDNRKGTHSKCWLAPDEQIVVTRYPKSMLERPIIYP